MSNIYTDSWVSPYGPEHRIKPGPAPTNKQRLDSVMRVIGHPLEFMLKWPEVTGAVGNQSEVDKALGMAEQRAVAAHRAALEKSVEKLAARRDLVRAELDELEGELKLLLSMLKAAGVVGDETPANGDSRHASVRKAEGKAVRRKEPVLNGKASGPDATALKLAAKGNVTPVGLAAVTGQTPINASNTLGRLARAGQLERVSRGVYGGV